MQFPLTKSLSIHIRGTNNNIEAENNTIDIEGAITIGTRELFLCTTADAHPHKGV